MRTETRTVYIALDGKEFDSKAEAEAHEEMLAVESILEKASIDWQDTYPREIAEFLVSRFNMEVKP